MLIYKAAYKFDESDENGWGVDQVLDFPAAISQGKGLEDARRMLGSALVDRVESYILDGQALPHPDSTLTDPDADLEEPIYLLMKGASHLRIVPAEATA